VKCGEFPQIILENDPVICRRNRASRALFRPATQDR
jgi:hypothetical protein